ncbi:helix-turn-helix transcriptional regulator [Pseudonocardia pini]|uniref:helix-turn-helix transcriptional regulator n=1 Tax=Pseudonocardia pini TaxID=2758030 RepID=UPI0015F0C16C|nr:WYL domain-containing protein [Pseudonocardia pini]
MRASRLMALLFVLQRRRAATAAELAAELEVSERTIYRDVASLTEVGVPIWTEPGPGGGIRLVEGWRTRLDGLTGQEAAAMFAIGAPQLLAELGMGTALAGAQAKILATLPEDLRAHTRTVAERVHLDAPGWFHAPAEVEHLGTLAEALWDQRRVSILYGPRRVRREVEPLGLVLKAGVWYLVARVDQDTRTYRAAKIAEATLLDATFERPDFDLPAWWAESAAEFAATMLRTQVRIRVSERGLRALKRVTDVEAAATAIGRACEPDAEGWRELALDVESLEVAAGQLVSLGGEVEGLDPELRSRLADHGRALLNRNSGPPIHGGTGQP